MRLIVRKGSQPMDLTDPSLYVNRELSWVRFNERVLEEVFELPSHSNAADSLCFSSNLDEFS